MKASNLRLVQISPSWPEQYYVCDTNEAGGSKVGYIRFKSGYFDAFCPDELGESVYECDFHDSSLGAFQHDSVRTYQLRKAMEAIAEWWNSH